MSVDSAIGSDGRIPSSSSAAEPVEGRQLPVALGLEVPDRVNSSMSLCAARAWMSYCSVRQGSGRAAIHSPARRCVLATANILGRVDVLEQRPRHPKKDVEAAIADVMASGLFRFSKNSGRGHRWATLLCRIDHREHTIAIWSTPRVRAITPDSSDDTLAGSPRSTGRDNNDHAQLRTDR